MLGYFLVAQLQDFLPYFLAVASSSFVYVALADLIPQLQKKLGLRGWGGHHDLLQQEFSRAGIFEQHPDWFAATVGGLGLTGLITWAEIQLRRVGNPYMDAETIKFGSLEAFFELSQASERDHEYTVSWIDCAFTGKRLGRGLFSRANHAPAAMDLSLLPASLPGGVSETSRRVPITPPLSLINTLSLKAFNTLYFHKQRAEVVRSVQHYRPFFYPLDAILEWNRIYGPRGSGTRWKIALMRL